MTIEVFKCNKNMNIKKQVKTPIFNLKEIYF